MKELSIEEKAKAYDDAIKRAKRMFSEKELNYLFPELAESDDEKIISAIRKAIEAKVENLGNGVTRTTCLAWLEKQGNTNIFDVPKISIKNAVEVTSRMQYIDDDIKPIAEFITDYANWDLHKDEWNQPTLTVPLFRVLDALIQKGKPYCACNQNIEKQCEQKKQVYFPKFTFDDILALQCCMETVKKVQEDKDLYEKLNDLHGRVYDAYHLEKQGKPVEINPNEFDSQLNKLLKQFETLPKKELINSLNFYLNVVKNGYLSDNVDPTDYNSIDPHFGKPVDKVELKFKVGDWCIDNEDGIVFQIVKVLDKTYRYRTSEGKEYSCARYSLELDARLWTISDAKNGDVLVDNLGNVCIYQESSTKLMYHSHCYGNHKYFIYIGGSHEIVGSYPATKEQCDTLMKAMADAGYTFDFEKKELKEIENEEYDGEDYGIDSLWHAKNILEKTLGKVDGYQTDDGILDHKCAISAVNKLYEEDAKINNRWKPSDEHIHWLKWVINRMPDTEKANEAEVVLKDLLEQLEEL